MTRFVLLSAAALSALLAIGLGGFVDAPAEVPAHLTATTAAPEVPR